MRLWQEVLHNPQRLADYYEKLWSAQLGHERRFYDAVRYRFNATQRPYYLLYLLARCVKASVRYNANGEFNQSPDNRRKGRDPKAMRRDIMRASALLHGKTCLLAEGYQTVLKLATPADLVYLAPPYQGVSANRDPRYIQGVDFEGFVQQLYELNARRIAYIVSYDGRTGDKEFGQPLPAELGLKRSEIVAGRSSQATLLGQAAITYESLYLSPALLEWLDRVPAHFWSAQVAPQQLSLFGESA